MKQFSYNFYCDFQNKCDINRKCMQSKYYNLHLKNVRSSEGKSVWLNVTITTRYNVVESGIHKPQISTEQSKKLLLEFSTNTLFPGSPNCVLYNRLLHGTGYVYFISCSLGPHKQFNIFNLNLPKRF